MSDQSTEHQGSHPATSAGARAFIVTPFARLARTHAGSAMADAMVTAALADSLFFSLPADDARAPVVRYLIITMLPFAVISPLVGPMIDRLKGGHRFVLIGTAVIRAVLCYLMVGQISSAGPTFFLLALLVLVSQKAYSVARSALVPTVVRDDGELVEANSKLSLISGIAGFVGIVPAAILLKVFGPGWALGLAMITYTAAAVLGTRIPPARVAAEKADETEKHELRGAGIILAGSAMGLIRMCVGFLTLLIAFDFRGGDRAPWEFAVVGAASVLSQLAGAAAAPRIRSMTSEENLLTGVLGLIVAGGFLAIVLGDVLGASILGSCVGFAAGGGKLAFDSILQRDAPDANRGRSFAKFETRFQVTWVIGAFIPVAIAIGARAGFTLVFFVGIVALASYVTGRLAWAHKTGTRQTAATAAAVGIEARFAEVSGGVRGRLAGAPRSAVRRLRSRPDALDPDGEHGEYDQDDAYDAEYDDEFGSRESGYQGEDHGHGADLGGDRPTTVASPPPDGSGRVRRPVDAPAHDGVRPEWADTNPPPSSAPVPDPGDLAAGSPTAWQPPPIEPEPAPTQVAYPWMPSPEPDTGDYLADLDPSVANPFPWSPAHEAPTRRAGPGDDQSAEDAPTQRAGSSEGDDRERTSRHEPRYRPRRRGH